MRQRSLLSLMVVAMLALVSSTGCEDQSATEPAAQSADNESTSTGEVEIPEFTDEEKQQIATAFAKLSDEDRALAEKQIICPVGGPLGKMGTPIKVMVPASDGGETPVFICCEGCREAVLADPEKHLAKLPK